jgi:hypothetical protein
MKQLNIKKFPYTIKDNYGREIYWELRCGYWSKREYDDNGNEIYFENSSGHWAKRECDDEGNEIYFEKSNGTIRDNKLVPEYTMEELVVRMGHNFKIKK